MTISKLSTSSGKSPRQSPRQKAPQQETTEDEKAFSEEEAPPTPPQNVTPRKEKKKEKPAPAVEKVVEKPKPVQEEIIKPSKTKKTEAGRFCEKFIFSLLRNLFKICLYRTFKVPNIQRPFKTILLMLVVEQQNRCYHYLSHRYARKSGSSKQSNHIQI